MPNSFRTIFGPYIDSDALLNDLEQGEILVLDIYKERGMAVAKVKFPAPVTFLALNSAQEKIRDALQIKVVRLEPKYAPDQFTAEYFPTLVQFLKQQASVVNGFFDGATAEFSGNKLTVELKNGGYDIIKQAGVDLQLIQLVQDQFSFLPELSFTGMLRLTQDDHDKVIKENTKELPVFQAPPPTEAPPVSSERAPWEDAPKKEDKKVTLSFTDLPFLSKDAVLVMGRKITERPVPLSEVSMESGRVCCWGDIFAIDRRESRDGSKLILSYNCHRLYWFQHLENHRGHQKGRQHREADKGRRPILFRGEASYDKYDREITIRPYDIMIVQKKQRMDNAQRKRVELHMHTNMSAMDARQRRGNPDSTPPSGGGTRRWPSPTTAWCRRSPTP